MNDLIPIVKFSVYNLIWKDAVLFLVLALFLKRILLYWSSSKTFLYLLFYVLEYVAGLDLFPLFH